MRRTGNGAGQRSRRATCFPQVVFCGLFGFDRGLFMGWLKRFQSDNKYLVFTLLYLGFCVSYVDRAAIGIALTAVAKEFQLAPNEMGIVISAFFVGYSIMQIPGGWLADKYGSKIVIITALFCWSLFTLGTGFAASLTMLLVIRFLFGLGEGPFPASSFKAIAEYFSKKERAKFTGGLVSSNYIGSALAPMIIVPLMIYFGWRNMFHVLGVLGLAYILFYFLLVRPRRVDEETQEDRENRGRHMKKLLSMPLMWKLIVAAFCISCINKGLDAWMPTYLLTVRHLDLKAVGILTPLPFIAAGLSSAMCGYVMDKFFNRKEQYLLAICAAGTAVFLYFMYTAQTVAGVIFFQCLVYFFKSCVLASAVAIPMKLMTGAVSGVASGLVNMGGQVAGFISPVIIGYLVLFFNGSYNAVFYYLIAAAALCVLCSVSIPRRRTDSVSL